MPERPSEEAIRGCILGTAVGDAIGLPMEGLSRARLSRIYGSPDRHHFIFGRGMVSDDTEHTIMVARALISSAGDADAFAHHLANQLRWWLLAVPAGTGLATAKACCRLLLGFGTSRSGVRSAGNGPAMRSALIGVCYGSDADRMRELVRASTIVTHTDPRAENGALAVALAAHFSTCGADTSALCERLEAMLGDDELVALVRRAWSSAESAEDTASFAEQLGYRRGVTGYVNATVPIALHAWFRYPNDYRSAVRSVIECGGDTDTVAAIVGGVVGARVGADGIPKEWLGGLVEWPRTTAWMKQLAGQLAGPMQNKAPGRPIGVNPLAPLLRNVFFLFVVILHGFRRLLPPY